MRLPIPIKCWRRLQAPAPVEPVRHVVVSMHVSDDGLSLTGRRYGGYLAAVTIRQQYGLPQDEVTVWIWDTRNCHVAGTPRVNEQGELEILARDQVLGVVRKLGDCLFYFPA